MNYFKNLFSLLPDEDVQETYKEIIDGARFKGYNLWLLSFTIIIACIGLNINSTSAIIGAMLISPLMGPILAFAFSIAINDSLLKKIAITNWLFMTVISLIASTLYFLISPFSDNTDQLLSFKNATIFDIALAFFGGLAGFIGVVKKDGTKILAGVAVATACMPPLCTAGYGIAKGNMEFFLGGLYFYIINCLYIGVATFLLSRFANYHTSLRKNNIISKTTNLLWVFLILLMLIPGTYLAKKKWDEQYSVQKSKTLEERIIELETKIEQLQTNK